MVFKLGKGIDFLLNYKFDRLDKLYTFLKWDPNEFQKGNNHNIFRSKLGFDQDIEYKLNRSRKVTNLSNRHTFDWQNHNILFPYNFHI